MKISVILAHPDKGSFNHAIAEVAVQVLCDAGHTVSFHDLYAEQFDPILPAQEIPSGSALPPQLKTHCDEIAEADGIIIVCQRDLPPVFIPTAIGELPSVSAP